ncbi:MAG: type VI secretion system contractile sheath large subunit [Bryobacteraceae bacterium]|jgi:type VI secretion system protein ImpC
MAEENEKHRRRGPSVHITYDVQLGDIAEARELPFVVGVVADLLGHPETAPLKLAERKFFQVDRENFDDVLRVARPRLAFEVENTLASGDAPLRVELRFRDLSDFEPENVARRTPLLRELLERRTKLAHLRASMNDALEDLLQEFVHSPESLGLVAAELKGTLPAGSLLEDVVVRGRLGRNLEERELGKQWVREFFVELLAGRMAVSKDTESMLSACIGCMDRALSIQLSKIMHHPEFQRLEAAWRGLEYLVSRTPASPLLKIRVLHANKDELRRDFQRAPEFDQSALFKKLYDEEYTIVGGEPFAVLAGDYYFSSGPEDVGLLESISTVAAAAHAPFIAGASPDMFNLEDFTELNRPRDIRKIFDTAFYAKWKWFRNSEDSKYTALVLPRMLLRPPYGETAAEVEAFQYEESADGRKHAGYLWGNPAYALAACLANAFHSYGWCAAVRGEEGGGLVEGLPTHRFPNDDGDAEVQCPTEIAIGERRAEELVESGFIPLLHRKGTSMAVFLDAPSCHKPKVFDTEAATAAAASSARLEYVMTASRFAHYLKAILRDKTGRFVSATECQQYLSDWIMGYVYPNAADAQTKALYPLADARVEVTDVAGRAGFYRAVIFLTPHFQLHSLPAPLRVLTTLQGLGS